MVADGYFSIGYVAALLDADPARHVLVVGHADPHGRPKPTASSASSARAPCARCSSSTAIKEARILVAAPRNEEEEWALTQLSRRADLFVFDPAPGRRRQADWLSDGHQVGVIREASRRRTSAMRGRGNVQRRSPRAPSLARRRGGSKAGPDGRQRRRREQGRGHGERQLQERARRRPRRRRGAEQQDGGRRRVRRVERRRGGHGLPDAALSSTSPTTAPSPSGSTRRPTRAHPHARRRMLEAAPSGAAPSSTRPRSWPAGRVNAYWDDPNGPRPDPTAFDKVELTVGGGR